ncbi:AAA family ATPase [Streptomyces sp. NPDC096205]|uniref:AAA family ATPase n=1 Tax=Streptomyces sp. NPDC096205 TaxID=3366081 RepID=UPI0037F60DA8
MGERPVVVLVERDAVAAGLREVFTGAVSGRGGVAVVQSGPGLGKTEVLHAFARWAEEEHGAAVLAAVCSPDERDVPLSAIAQLLAGAPESMSELHDVADDVAEGRLDAAGARLMHNALLGGDRPVVMVVDDVHLADEVSLRRLGRFIHRARSAPVAIVVSVCDGFEGPFSQFLTELLRQPSFRRFTLTTLSADGVAELLAERFAGVGREQALAWRAMTGGNPLLIRALLEDVQEQEEGQPTPAPSLPAPRTFPQALTSLLRRMPALAREVAVTSALLDCFGGAEHLVEVLGLDERSVWQAVSSLEAAGIACGGTIRHPMLSQLLLDSLDRPQRAALHRRAADVLASLNAPAQVTAAHLLEAEEPADVWAIPVLCEAADTPRSEGRFLDAARLLELAMDSTPFEEERAEILMELIGCEWNLDPAMACRRLPDAVAAYHDGHLLGEGLDFLVRHMLWQGDEHEVVAICAALPEERRRELLERLGPWLAVTWPGILERIPGHAEPATQDRLPHALGLEARGAGLLRDMLAGGPAHEAIAFAETCLLGAAEGRAFAPAVITALDVLIYADRLDRAALHCASLRADAQAHGQRTRGALLTAMSAEIALRQGALESAADLAAEALKELPAKAWGPAVGLPLSVLITAQTLTGRLSQAAEALSHPVPAGIMRTRWAVHYLYARGRYHRAMGAQRAATDDFRTCGELMRSWKMDLPAVVPWRTEVAELLWETEESDQARGLAEEQLRACPTQSRRARGISLRALAATSAPRSRLRLLNEAVEDLEKGGDQLELARALDLLSKAYFDLGMTRPARASAQRASGVARRISYQLGSARTGEHGAVTHFPAQREPVHESLDAAADELTEAEQRVAVLAAKGYTNRQISQKLFVTVSTVEQHLTRIYRKLQVNRRSDLGDFLPLISPAEAV